MNIENTGHKYTARLVPQYTPKPKRVYRRKESALALAMLAMGYLYIRLVINGASHLGKTVFVFLLVFVSFVFLKLFGKKFPAPAYASAAVSLAFGVSFSLCTAGIVGFISANAFQLSYIYFIYKCFDLSVEKSPGILFDFEIIKSVIIYPFSSFTALFPALFSSSRKEKGKGANTALYIILGLAASVIPTIIIVNLLSYDKSFTSLFQSFDRAAAAERIAAVIFGIPAAMYLFGLWISSIDKKSHAMDESGCSSIRKKARVLPQAAVISSVTPILAVYALFFFSQLSYFTSAFGGVLPEGYSFAEYARSGFFELCAVTFINTAILVLIYLFAKRGEDGKRGAVMTVYTLLICISNIILIATAVSKMLLYIRTYGLTVMRAYTTWFMLCLALVFAVFIISAAVKKIKAVPVALAVIIIMTCTLSLSNMPALVSRYNTDKILSGYDLSLDAEYFEQLGSSAVPDAVRLVNSGRASADTKKAAAEFLGCYEESLEYKESFGIFSFNVPDMLAARALKER